MVTETKKDHYISVPREKFEAMERELAEFRKQEIESTFYVEQRKREYFPSFRGIGDDRVTIFAFRESSKDSLNILFKEIREEIKNNAEAMHAAKKDIQAMHDGANLVFDNAAALLAEVSVKAVELNKAIVAHNKRFWAPDVNPFEFKEGKELTNLINIASKEIHRHLKKLQKDGK